MKDADQNSPRTLTRRRLLACLTAAILSVLLLESFGAGYATPLASAETSPLRCWPHLSAEPRPTDTRVQSASPASPFELSLRPDPDPYPESTWPIQARPSDELLIVASISIRADSTDVPSGLQVQIAVSRGQNDHANITEHVEIGIELARVITAYGVRSVEIDKSRDPALFQSYAELEKADRLELRALVTIGPDAPASGSVRLSLNVRDSSTTDHTLHPSEHLGLAVRGHPDLDIREMSSIQVGVSNSTPLPGESVAVCAAVTNTGTYPIYDSILVLPSLGLTEGTHASLVEGTLWRSITNDGSVRPQAQSQSDGSIPASLMPGSTLAIQYRVRIAESAEPGTTHRLKFTLSPSEVDIQGIQDRLAQQSTTLQLTIAETELRNPATALRLDHDRLALGVQDTATITATISVPADSPPLRLATLRFDLPAGLPLVPGSGLMQSPASGTDSGRWIPDHQLSDGYTLPSLEPGTSTSVSLQVEATPRIAESGPVTVNAILTTTAANVITARVPLPTREPDVLTIRRFEEFEINPGKARWSRFILVNAGRTTLHEGLLRLRYPADVDYLPKHRGYVSSYSHQNADGIELNEVALDASFPMNGEEIDSVRPGDTVTIWIATGIRGDASPGSKPIEISYLAQGNRGWKVYRAARTFIVPEPQTPEITAENVVCLQRAVIGDQSWREDVECLELVAHHAPEYLGLQGESHQPSVKVTKKVNEGVSAYRVWFAPMPGDEDGVTILVDAARCSEESDKYGDLRLVVRLDDENRVVTIVDTFHRSSGPSASWARVLNGVWGFEVETTSWTFRIVSEDEDVLDEQFCTAVAEAPTLTAGVGNLVQTVGLPREPGGNRRIEVIDRDKVLGLVDTPSGSIGSETGESNGNEGRGRTLWGAVDSLLEAVGSDLVEVWRRLQEAENADEAVVWACDSISNGEDFEFYLSNGRVEVWSSLSNNPPEVFVLRHSLVSSEVCLNDLAESDVKPWHGVATTFEWGALESISILLSLVLPGLAVWWAFGWGYRSAGGGLTPWQRLRAVFWNERRRMAATVAALSLAVVAYGLLAGVFGDVAAAYLGFVVFVVVWPLIVFVLGPVRVFLLKGFRQREDG